MDGPAAVVVGPVEAEALGDLVAVAVAAVAPVGDGNAVNGEW